MSYAFTIRCHGTGQYSTCLYSRLFVKLVSQARVRTLIAAKPR